jgi:uncharacterized protein (DUF433 family)
MARQQHGHRAVPPEQVPAYSPREVAGFLQLPSATVRSWVLGTTYRGRDGERWPFPAVIRIADKSGRRLSFENLIEVHVLSSLRRQHKVRLDAVRRAVRYLRRELGTEHPLAEQEMLTDGVDIFIDRYGRLTNASQQGQEAMRDLLRRYLTRIDRTPAGKSIRLYPITRSVVDQVDAVPKFVAIDPRYRFGQPFLVGSGVETSVVAGRHRAGDSLKELAGDLGVSEEAIEEALRYELRAAA